MALFPASFIDDLKSHVDIVQVVQERVPLRRSGAAWKGLCPFHGEKTPSFHVNGDKGFFHCFGCGVGGDVIKFVELYDKVAFPDAVRQLAARAGLTVPEADDAREDAESQRERETLLKAHEVAAAWFDTVKAPEKQLVWFEHSGHMPMTEERGKFLLSLVRYARPFAEKAGDVTP